MAGELCTQDLALIRGWKLRDMDKGKAGTLTPEGRAEVEGIASRFKAAFPDLVYKRYSISKTAAENVRQQPGEGTKVGLSIFLSVSISLAVGWQLPCTLIDTYTYICI